jgi:hypothetical protein
LLQGSRLGGTDPATETLSIDSERVGAHFAAIEVCLEVVLGSRLPVRNLNFFKILKGNWRWFSIHEREEPPSAPGSDDKAETPEMFHLSAPIKCMR